ncbi:MULTISPECIES: BadF/BadG/BcrA/BcrD ATPase family protein [unclassified Streptomyces]|uniref:N-acetylglucosamine kinase n=1 Tax=unclassified Streptomyces TaxID=2593676 RepID=UPI002E158959|nr:MULTISPECIES: BadF/BadG/BcrA/BcrD ATPase family protein [unclassified Streptomyces]WSR26071.1 ATPase [Streptomyces sp. NBC_01205]
MGVTGAARSDRPSRPAVLAIDAGNSKTDAALIAADGTVLGTGRAGGFQPQRTGTGAALDVLGKAVAEAAEAASLPRPAPGAPYADQVSACLANADLPVEERQLAEAIGARGWGAATEVFNDTFAILRAGLTGAGPPCGVAVVCGAGINCVGMRPDGRTARFPALGQLSGDWGGGGGLAAEALWWAARAEDGRGGTTELAAALPGHFGLDSMAELIEALHLGALAQRRTHELVPVLFSVAAAGDRVASALVERQADEVVALASVALARLDLLDEEAPVLLGGGVLTAGHEQLDGRIAAGLARRAPHARVSVVAAPPVLGAGLLGLDALGALPGAQGKLRAHFG